MKRTYNNIIKVLRAKIATDEYLINILSNVPEPPKADIKSLESNIAGLKSAIDLLISQRCFEKEYYLYITKKSKNKSKK